MNASAASNQTVALYGPIPVAAKTGPLAISVAHPCTKFVIL